MRRHATSFYIASTFLVWFVTSISVEVAEHGKAKEPRIVRSEKGAAKDAEKLEILPDGTTVLVDETAVAAKHASRNKRPNMVGSLSIEDKGASLAEDTANMSARTRTFGRVEANFFSGNGWPTGTRKDISAQVGFSFVSKVDFKISALGRRLNKQNRVMQETTVTLWGPHQDILARMRIGPSDMKEDGYVWKELKEAVAIKAKMEYRITQECAKDMADPWFDGLLKDTQVHIHEQTASDYAEIRHGVSSTDEFGYPANNDGIGRRAGMLNFRIWVVPTYDRSRCCAANGNGMCNEGVPQPGYLSFDECMQKCRFPTKNTTCMGLEFSHMQCDTPEKCKCHLVPEGACGSSTFDYKWSYFSVFGPKRTARLSQGHSGRLEVRHNGEWGTVCKDGFTTKDAKVVCRQMHLWDGTIMLPADIKGPAATSKILMSEVICEGGEPEIQDCAFAGWGKHTCSHSMDIGVTCVLPTPGPRGPRGPLGYPGIPADKNAEDYLGVPGPQGFRGPAGPPGPLGEAGKNAASGDPGDKLPDYDLFIIKSYHPAALVTMPILLSFVGMSLCVTFCLYYCALSNFVRKPREPKKTSLQEYVEDAKDLKAIYGEMNKKLKPSKSKTRKDKDEG